MYEYTPYPYDTTVNDLFVGGYTTTNKYKGSNFEPSV